VRVKERQRGYDEATRVESFVVLNAAGGECLDDFARLREDRGLAELLGQEIPSPEAARKFLYQFDDAERIEVAQEQRRLGQVAYIAGENAALPGLGEVNRDLLEELVKRCPDQKIATVDEDATIMTSRKREALVTYEGGRGYQPLLAVWAETNVVLADEFRDGNVPALMEPLNVARGAFAALPPSVETRYFRGDSACHESRLVNWLRDEQREEGPAGFIGFAISARMSEGLHAALLAVPPEAGQPDGEDAEVIRECAEVVYVPSEKSEKKDRQPCAMWGLACGSGKGSCSRTAWG
jgi:Transposase DDE domain group 1